MRWMLCVVLCSGCGAFSRVVLFADTPTFTLVAASSGQETGLEAAGYDPDWLEDALCDEDDGEDCVDDLFRGFVYYRADDGAYGAYAALHIGPEPAWIDPTPPLPGTAWRVGVLRQKGDLDPYLSEVSTAATLE